MCKDASRMSNTDLLCWYWLSSSQTVLDFPSLSGLKNCASSCMSPNHGLVSPSADTILTGRPGYKHFSTSFPGKE
eukprot:g56472.t1